MRIELGKKKRMRMAEEEAGLEEKFELAYFFVWQQVSFFLNGDNSGNLIVLFPIKLLLMILNQAEGLKNFDMISFPPFFQSFFDVDIHFSWFSWSINKIYIFLSSLSKLAIVLYINYAAAST